MRKHILFPLIALAMATPVSAHPYFIRLGYSSCTACHISPQGGGILTPYGGGVERALSLFQDPEQGERKSPPLSYDMRALVVGSSTEGVPASSFQLLSLSSLKISAHQRLTSTISVTSPTVDGSRWARSRGSGRANPDLAIPTGRWFRAHGRTRHSADRPWVARSGDVHPFRDRSGIARISHASQGLLAEHSLASDALCLRTGR